MKLQRLISLSRADYAKIRARQKNGTMTEYLDEDGYICFDENELKTYKPNKAGVKPNKIKKGE